MTVKQLIERLQLLPPEARVVVNMGKNEFANGREATTVVSEQAYLDRHFWQADYFPEYDDSMKEKKELVVNITP